jgi:hypothetical protein
MASIDPDGKSELRKYVLYRDGSMETTVSFDSEEVADSNPTNEISSLIP